jgi:ABC-type Na+ transport system ATPase subunit NatA
VAAHGLVCQFGPVRAVDDLSFEVAEGEVFGLDTRGSTMRDVRSTRRTARRVG